MASKAKFIRYKMILTSILVHWWVSPGAPINVLLQCLYTVELVDVTTGRSISRHL
jgi:hypothetical protein